MVKDINPGAGGSSPGAVTNFNGTLYFSANDGTHGYELWKSDGTAAGTTIVKDIAPLATSSSRQSLTALNGALYFNANDGTHGYELWKSDGTAAGTVLLEDIDAGAGSSTPFDFAAINGGVEFYAFDGANYVCSDPMGPPRARSNLPQMYKRRRQSAQPARQSLRTSTATRCPTSYGRTRAARPRSGA